MVRGWEWTCVFVLEGVTCCDCLQMRHIKWQLYCLKPWMQQVSFFCHAGWIVSLSGSTRSVLSDSRGKMAPNFGEPSHCITSQTHHGFVIFLRVWSWKFYTAKLCVVFLHINKRLMFMPPQATSRVHNWSNMLRTLSFALDWSFPVLISYFTTKQRSWTKLEHSTLSTHGQCKSGNEWLSIYCRQRECLNVYHVITACISLMVSHAGTGNS